jgi:hypothetical protein
MRLVIGHSDDVDAADAMMEVVRQCTAQLDGDSPPIAGLLLAGIDYDHAALLKVLGATWPDLPIIGGTTDGEFSSSGGYHDDSVALTLFCGSGVEAGFGVGRGLSEGVGAAVSSAVSAASAGHDEPPVICLTIPESMTANCTEIVDALQHGLGPECPIFGGVSGDHREFGTTYQFAGGEVLSDSVPLLLFWGDLAVSYGVASGWRPVGSTFKVTKAEGNVVYTIDDRPILDVFEDHWGDSYEWGVLGEFPLAVFPDPEDTDNFYLRAVFGVDSEQGTATFAATVPEGATVRLAEVLRDGLLEGSSMAIDQALKAFPGESPGGGVVFSCAARKWLLGSRVGEESDLFNDALVEKAVPFVGWYAFGEIAPLAGGGRAFYHNETCIAVLFGSRSGN